MRGIVVYPAEIRLFARGLFLQGNSYLETAKLVKKQYPGARCNAETIRRWAMKESWDESRHEVQRSVDVHQRSEAAEVLEKHKALYQLMIEKGEKGLRTKDNLPRSASEAGSLLDTGIKGQRVALRDLVSLSFIKAVLAVVSEEISDETTRRRIALRFRELSEAGVPLQGGEL